jgi:hypothetical protein
MVSRVTRFSLKAWALRVAKLRGMQSPEIALTTSADRVASQIEKNQEPQSEPVCGV